MCTKFHPYWLSWKSDDKDFSMYFPWWDIRDFRNGGHIHYAAVWARSDEDAMEIIRNSYRFFSKPKFIFCKRQLDDWNPFCSKFPRAEWMRWWTDGRAVIATPEKLSDEIIVDELPEIIRIARESRGLSKSQLSEISGINPVTLRYLEYGRRNNFTMQTVIDVLHCLGYKMNITQISGEERC